MSFFKILWSNYPSNDPCDAKDKNGSVLFKNQCAIRLSTALNKSGVALSSFPKSRKCWVHGPKNEVLAASELADWLDRGVHPYIKKSITVTGEQWREKVGDKTGIICFEDYYAATGGSGGDHIDLWDGNSLTGLGSWMRTRFNIVVPGFWSDFRKAKRIRFFEVV